MNTWLSSIGNQRHLLMFRSVTLSGLSKVFLPPAKTVDIKRNCRSETDWHQLLKPRLSARKQRLFHLLWHEVRQSWDSLSGAQQSALKGFGWEPARSVRKTPSTTNGSGEDFLFYTRKMLLSVDQWLARSGLEMDVWSNDDETPQDRSGESMQQRIERFRQDYQYWGALVREYHLFRDPQQLSQMSLAQLGNLLEKIIREKMQVRWANVPWQGGRPTHNIDQQWDNESYDWLADEYSTQVNKLFWYLHKWVDCRVKDWYQARADCVQQTPINGVPWYSDRDESQCIVSVSDPWLGGGMVNFTESDETLNNMEAVFAVLQQSR